MTLKNCNPVAAALCFLEILLVSMFIPNPILLCVSFAGAVLFCTFLASWNDLRRSLLLCLFLSCFITAINPFFSHNGVTVLYYFNDNPVTLEAYLYGAGIGLMVSSVFIWCKALSLVLTADKTVYLFGRMTPKTAIVLSTALRYIPMLKKQSKRLARAQKTLGQTSSDGYFDRVKAVLHTFNALVGWSLERAVETADSMRARGYGKNRRTTYSDITFRLRDLILIVLCVCLVSGVMIVSFRHGLDFSYYPAVTVQWLSFESSAAVIMFSVLSFLPSILEVKERIKWKRLKSKI
ncbi:MAG: energy-coupling factor transporter transmembrane protein EcfT [Clostridia bacterium]|nr:energy-coupling factor transporter transmembrane protein EcfT [Clostridia bacterium]